jgi:hypothetical protein
MIELSMKIKILSFPQIFAAGNGLPLVLKAELSGNFFYRNSLVLKYFAIKYLMKFV